MTRLHKVYSNVEVLRRHIWCGTVSYVSAEKDRWDILKYLLQPGESFICMSFPSLWKMTEMNRPKRESFCLVSVHGLSGATLPYVYVCMYVYMCTHTHTHIYIWYMYIYYIQSLKFSIRFTPHSLLHLLPDTPPCSLTKFLSPFFFFLYKLLRPLCTAYIFMHLQPLTGVCLNYWGITP